MSLRQGIFVVEMTNSWGQKMVYDYDKERIKWKLIEFQRIIWQICRRIM